MRKSCTGPVHATAARNPTAVDQVFGTHAQVQRCQWHKHENVVSYRRKTDQATYRRKLQRAYEKPTYAAAKKALMDIHAELETLNRSAARSLMEGPEETEQRMRRIDNFAALPKLREALQREIENHVAETAGEAPPCRGAFQLALHPCPRSPRAQS